MLQNQLLAQTQTKIDETVKNQDAYRRIVKAAMRAVYDKDIFEKLTSTLSSSKDPVGEVAEGCVAVIAMLSNRAQGKMPQDAAVQAGMALLLTALDTMEQAGLIKVDNGTLERAMHEYIDAFLPAMGLSPQVLQGALKQVDGVLADEQKMAQFKAQGGTQ
jgi:hypothetical protein